VPGSRPVSSTFWKSFIDDCINDLETNTAHTCGTLKSNHVGNPDRQSLPFGLVLHWPLRATTPGFRRFARPIFDWFTQSAEAPHQSGSFMAHAVGKKNSDFPGIRSASGFQVRPLGADIDPAHDVLKSANVLRWRRLVVMRMGRTWQKAQQRPR
jgi:hypothetical protein